MSSTVLFIRGGVDTVWASLIGVATLVWPLRHDLFAADRLAPLALAGLAGWQAGCLWRGSCLGLATDLPWGWALPGSATNRHPVELYAALLLAVGAIIVARVHRPSGLALALAVTWAAGARLVTEPLRPHLGSGRLWFYAVGVVTGLAVTSLIVMRARSPGNPPHLVSTS